MTNLITHNLFPTPVGITHIQNPVTEFEYKWIESLNKQLNKGNLTSVNTYIFNEKCMERIALFCEEGLNNFFQEVYKPANPNTKLRITQSWANYTNINEYHHTHTHPNSFISGVFYVDTNEQDKIIFYKPDQSFRISANEFNHWNSISWWMPTEPNSLLLFPSTLHHGVDPKETEGTRISISFNTFLTGEIGEGEFLTQLFL